MLLPDRNNSFFALDSLIAMRQDIVYLLDLFGTVIFAITGAVKGVRLRLDLFGVMVYAVTVGCAGGMIRDCLLGVSPVAALTDSNYVLVSALTGLVVFFTARMFVGRWRVILYCDAIGLGVFTAIGCEKAALLGLGAVGQLLSGLIGAVGGGVLRDVFSKEIPSVLKTDFYATASIIGAVLYMVLENIPALDSSVDFFLSAFSVMVIRIYAIRHNLKLPVARMAGEE